MLLAGVPGARVNGRDAPRVATATSVTFPGVDGMALLARLDAAGVMGSQVSACSTGRPEPSRALLAMRLAEEDAFSTPRSVSVLTTRSDVEEAAAIVAREALHLRQVMGAMA